MYINTWINTDTGEIIKNSPDRPAGEYIHPRYAPTRMLSRNRYIPYEGNSEWVKAANRAMAHNSRP